MVLSDAHIQSGDVTASCHSICWNPTHLYRIWQLLFKLRAGKFMCIHCADFNMGLLLLGQEGGNLRRRQNLPIFKNKSVIDKI